MVLPQDDWPPATTLLYQVPPLPMQPLSTMSSRRLTSSAGFTLHAHSSSMRSASQNNPEIQTLPFPVLFDFATPSLLQAAHHRASSLENMLSTGNEVRQTSTAN